MLLEFVGVTFRVAVGNALVVVLLVGVCGLYHTTISTNCERPRFVPKLGVANYFVVSDKDVPPRKLVSRHLY